MSFLCIQTQTYIQVAPVHCLKVANEADFAECKSKGNFKSGFVTRHIHITTHNLKLWLKFGDVVPDLWLVINFRFCEAVACGTTRFNSIYGRRLRTPAIEYEKQDTTHYIKH